MLNRCVGRPLGCALFFLGTFAGTVSGSVLVVDAVAGPYTSIAGAVADAIDGDIVLVKAGSYGGFTITGKGVSVLADSGVLALVTGQVRVVNVSAGQLVVLSKLHVAPPNLGSETSALYAQDVHGSLRVQNCLIEGADGSDPIGPCAVPSTPNGWDAAFVTHCDDVVFTATQLLGGTSTPESTFECFNPSLGYPGGHGIQAWYSVVTTCNVTALGGDGGSGFCYGADGGDGVRLHITSKLFASALVARGGDGGSGGEAFICSRGGSGGWGLRVSEPATSAHLLACSFGGGNKGNGTDYSGSVTSCGSPDDCGDGNTGLATGGLGTVFNSAGSAKVLVIPQVLRANEHANLLFTGTAGDAVLLLFSLSVQNAYLAKYKGSLLVGNPFFGPYALGSAPANGALVVPLLVPQLGAGIEGILIHLQGALGAAGSAPTLSNATSIVLLGPGF